MLRNDCGQIEIILVNDGSTDNSLNVCEEYANHYSFVKVFSKDNGGAASARNVGLDHANGEYISFVDADDYVSGNYTKVILNSIDDSNIDLLVFSFCCEYTETLSRKEYLIPDASVLSPDLAVVQMETYGVLNIQTNKVYKKDVISGHPKIRFRKGTEPGEDLIFNCDCVLKSSVISFVSDVLYFWVRRGEDTLANKFRRDLYQKNLMFIDYRNRLYSSLGIFENYQELLAKGNLDYIFVCIPNMYREGHPFPRRDRIGFYNSIFSSDDVDSWISKVNDPSLLIRQFIIIYRLKSAWIADLYYSSIMGIRNRHKQSWNAFRKKKNI